MLVDRTFAGADRTKDVSGGESTFDVELVTRAAPLEQKLGNALRRRTKLVLIKVAVLQVQFHSSIQNQARGLR